MTIIDQAFLRAYGRRAESRSTERMPRTPAIKPFGDAEPTAARTIRPAYRTVVLEPDEQRSPMGLHLDPSATDAAELVRARVQEMQAERSARPVESPRPERQSDLSTTMNLLSHRQNELRSRPLPAGRPQAQPVESRPAPVSAKRPLSVFTNPTPVQEPPPDSRSLETARFHWPRLCLELASKHRTDFEHVLDGLFKWKLHGRSVIAITGCYAGQGCTTLTLSLAKMLADFGKPTAVVEANFAAPCLAERMDVYPQASWQDVLWRGIPIGEALILSMTEPVSMLLLNPNDICRPNGEISNEAFTTSRVLQNNYDFVLVDLGPMLAPEHQTTALEMAAAMAAQGSLIVSDSSVSLPGDPEVVGRLLSQAGCEPLGVVESFAEQRVAEYRRAA